MSTCVQESPSKRDKMRCAGQGCDAAARAMCARCMREAYCSAECQRAAHTCGDAFYAVTTPAGIGAKAKRTRDNVQDEEQQDAVDPITLESIAKLEPSQRLDLTINGHRFSYDLDALSHWLRAQREQNAHDDRAEVQARRPTNPATGREFDAVDLARIELAAQARIAVLTQRFYSTANLQGALCPLLNAYGVTRLAWDSPVVVARLVGETGRELAECFTSLRQLKRVVDDAIPQGAFGERLLRRLPAFWRVIFERLARPSQQPEGWRDMDGDELCAQGLELLRMLDNEFHFGMIAVIAPSALRPKPRYRRYIIVPDDYTMTGIWAGLESGAPMPCRVHQNDPYYTLGDQWLVCWTRWFLNGHPIYESAERSASYPPTVTADDMVHLEQHLRGYGVDRIGEDAALECQYVVRYAPPRLFFVPGTGSDAAKEARVEHFLPMGDDDDPAMHERAMLFGATVIEATVRRLSHGEEFEATLSDDPLHGHATRVRFTLRDVESVVDMVRDYFATIPEYERHAPSQALVTVTINPILH